MINRKGYDSVIVHLFIFSVHLHVILHYELSTIGNIYCRVICFTRGFSISTFSYGALEKYRLSEATLAAHVLRIPGIENVAVNKTLCAMSSVNCRHTPHTHTPTYRPRNVMTKILLL